MSLILKVKVLISSFILFFFGYILFPGSLEVDAERYYARYSELKVQHAWLTPGTFELIWWKGKMLGIQPGLGCAFIDAESDGRCRVVSVAGAVGLMQVMPRVYVEMRKRAGDKNIDKWNLLKPNVNICAGFTILKYCLDKSNGNVILAAKYYNAGNSSYFNGPYIIKIVKSLAISYPDATMREVMLASSGSKI